MPTNDNIAGFIALWWTDLSLKAQSLSDAAEEDGQILYEQTGTPGNYVFIIQFENVRHFHNLASDKASTFQLKIFENDNHIEMHYKELVANQKIHSIGIESPRQDEGVKYFRTSGNNTFPSGGSSEFAISFIPSESAKLTSSLRYGAEGNTLQHVFTVDESVAGIGDFDFSDFEISASIVEDIDFDNAVLLNTDPAQFALSYKLFDSLSSEVGGAISGDYVDFEIDGSDFFTLDSQTIFMSQAKEFEDAEGKITNQVFNDNGTVYAFKSKANLLSSLTKSVDAADVFFVGRDPDTLAAEVFQLTSLSGTEKCGPPFLDDTDTYSYLYVLCETGAVSNEVALRRYDLNSYLDDDLSPVSITETGTTHIFSGNIETQALVVAGDGNVAYARDVGGSVQDIYLNGVSINTNGSGSIFSLASDTAGTQFIYVLDSTAYFYNGSETTLAATNVGSAHISADGSTLVLNSTDDLDVSADNSDGSSEVFTVLTSSLATFEQRTDLGLVTDICKLPVLSEKALRIALVCNNDLLNLGNDFSDREGVFIIETVTGEDVTHLLTGASDISENISGLAMSSDGSNLSFQDSDEENIFRILGLSKLDSTLEELTSKSYPTPFQFSGDGKSGSLIYFSFFLFAALFVRRVRLRMRG